MSLEEPNRRDPGPAQGRALAMALVVMVAFGLVLTRLWSLQIRRGEEFRERSRNNFFRFERLEHARGEIVDRDGRVLVTNRPSSNVYVTPAFFPRTDRLLARLGAPVGVARSTARDLAQAVERAAEERGPPVLLATRLERAEVAALRRTQRELDLRLDAVPVIEIDGGYAAYVDPAHFPSLQLGLRRLADLLELPPEESKSLARRLRGARGLERYRDILVQRDLSPRVEGPLTLQVELGELPGVTVRRATARDYRYGTLGAHVVGYVNEVSLDDLRARRSSGYRTGDIIGRRGVERAFEDELRGVDGRETVVVDSKGRAQSSAFAEELQRAVGTRESPRPGHRVVLTLDLELQSAAEAAFDGRAGAVVLMEVRTGRLLALTSTPSFDPSRLAGRFDPSEQARLDALVDLRPWRFRAIQEHFAPGSTFKVVTALAALESGHGHIDEKIACPGHYTLGGTRWRCWRDAGHGLVDLRSSLAWSCDTYYYNLGARLGVDPIVDMARRLGFGSPTGVELGPESSGILPSRDWFRRQGRTYTLGQAVNASIGQGAVSVTPLQLAVAFAAIANGGRVMRPRIAARVETYDGRLVQRFAPEVRRELRLDAEHLDGVREGLRRVVQHPTGTARAYRLEGLEVGGKTGTAQVRRMGNRRRSRQAEWKYKDHAWFAAYAPAQDPEVVVVVFNEHGGSGSKAAAPIAMQVLEAWRSVAEQRRLSVEPGVGREETVTTSQGPAR